LSEELGQQFVVETAPVPAAAVAKAAPDGTSLLSPPDSRQISNISGRQLRPRTSVHRGKQQAFLLGVR
jgi:hypothetical protein